MSHIGICAYGHIELHLWLHGHPENQDDLTRCPVKTRRQHLYAIQSNNKLSYLGNLSLYKSPFNYKVAAM